MVHVKSKISIMVWAVISREKKSQLHIVTENSPGKKRGFNSRQYIQTLKNGLLPLYDEMRHFQQDNASIHTAKAVESFLLEHKVSILEWPPYSPDLNPIEHVWNLLKRRLFKLFPYLFDLKQNLADIEEFKECLQKAWATITQEEIRDLIDSMPRRLAAVIEAKGWYTKY